MNYLDAIQCGPVPELREWRELPAAGLTRGERVMRFIEKYCRIPEGAMVGQPLRLAEFQEAFIRSIYDNPHGTRRAYKSVARKNGKTGEIAALLLAHLVGPEARPNSQIASGAMSRDQAALVFGLASKMVTLNPDLQKHVRIVPSSKKLLGLPRNVEFRALAADGKTAHGLSLALAILDEVGQVSGPQSAFVDAVVTSQGAHENPLLIVISTQAPTDADLLSTWLDDAAQSKDPKIVSHVYSAEADAEVMDVRAWAAANPALDLFRSREDLQEQARQADRMPSAENTFRNLGLNQRVSTVSPFVSQSVWAANGGDPGVYPQPGVPTYAGLDLSGRTDLTAFVLIQWSEGRWRIYPYFWTPESGLHDRAKRDRVPYDVWVREGYLQTTPGATVDYEYVATQMGEACADLDLRVVMYDRWRMDLLQKELDRIGVDLPLEPMGQGFKDMSPALDGLEAELLNERMAHGAHPVLTMCAANAVTVKDPAGNRKLDKHKATGRIDGMVALAMALAGAGRQEEEEEATQAFVDLELI